MRRSWSWQHMPSRAGDNPWEFHAWGRSRSDVTRAIKKTYQSCIGNRPKRASLATWCGRWEAGLLSAYTPAIRKWEAWLRYAIPQREGNRELGRLSLSAYTPTIGNGNRDGCPVLLQNGNRKLVKPNLFLDSDENANSILDVSARLLSCTH